MGGWRCYITNVIKKADVVRDFQKRDKKQLAVEWTDVLTWEMQRVAPKTLFTVGGAATELVTFLQPRGLVPACPSPHQVMHYSNRGKDATDVNVTETIVREIQSGLMPQHLSH